MNGKRCAILLELSEFGPVYVDKYRSSQGTKINVRRWACIFGSHSEAKRELAKWLPAWPNAKIVNEEDL